MTDRLVWIDCEMTGLDLERDALIEIACLVTDGDLNLLDSGIDEIIKPPAEALEQMADVVREMHTASGLLSELESGITLAEAQERVLQYVRRYVPEPRKVPLAGNSIATDRAFLARDMPELDAYLHYRMVDVSSIKELARRWYPRVYFASPPKAGGHRALADITESVRELHYYRDAIFVPQPGPDSAAAREIAARYGGTQRATLPSSGPASGPSSGPSAGPSSGQPEDAPSPLEGTPTVDRTPPSTG
jgi:oligoribonuclease